MPPPNPLICKRFLRELCNCYDYFLRLSVFPDLFCKAFLINAKFSLIEFTTCLREQCKQNKLLKWYKRLLFLKLSLEIFWILNTIAAKFLLRFTILLLFYKLFSLRLLKEELAIDLFYCVSQEMRLENWWKLICIDQSRSFLS